MMNLGKYCCIFVSELYIVIFILKILVNVLSIFFVSSQNLSFWQDNVDNSTTLSLGKKFNEQE